MRRLQEIEELKRIGRLISSTSEIDQVYAHILQGAVAISGAAHAALFMMDHEHRTITAHVRRNGQTITKEVDLNAFAPSAVPMRDSPSAATHNASEKSVGRTPWLSIYRRVVPDARSYLYAPVISGSQNERIGLLAIGSPEPTKFGPDDLRLLEALANQAAVADQTTRYAQAADLVLERQALTAHAVGRAEADSSLVHRINYTVGAIPALIQQIELELEQGTLEEAALRERLQGIRAGADLALEMLRHLQTTGNGKPE
jgi:GAF domain-containing protein